MLKPEAVPVPPVAVLAMLETEGGLICNPLLCAFGNWKAAKVLVECRGLEGDEQMVAMEGNVIFPMILIVGLEGLLGDPHSCTLFRMVVGLEGGVPLGHLLGIITGQDIIQLRKLRFAT